MEHGVTYAVVRTFESFALGDADDVDHLVLAEHVADRHRLLHVFTRPVHLVRHRAAVELDLHYVRLLLTTLHQTHLSTARQRTAGHPSLQQYSLNDLFPGQSGYTGVREVEHRSGF